MRIQQQNNLISSASFSLNHIHSITPRAMSADPHFSSDDRSSCSEEYQLGLNAFYEVDEPCDLIRWPRTLSPPVEFVVLESEQKKFQIQNFPTLKCSHFIEHASLEWNIRHAASSNVIAELQNPVSKRAQANLCCFLSPFLLLLTRMRILFCRFSPVL
jgi:hypothetical protein